MRVSSLVLVVLLAASARADTLIRGATILPQSAPALEGDVLIRDERIVKVAAHIDAPAGATVIEGKGRFLIPGLIDVHVHIAEEEILPDLFVPHGVTTVRDLGNRLELVKKLAADRDPMRPEVVFVGPILDGQPPVWPTISEVLETPEQVAPVLRRLKEAGCGWFKVYENLRPAVYDAIVKEAKALGVRVIGHVPKAVGVLHCIESGQDTLEHLDHFEPALARTPIEPTLEAELAAWRDVDPEKEKALVAKLVAHGARLDPTRVVNRNYSLVARGLTPSAPGARYVSKAFRDAFWSFFTNLPRASATVDEEHERSFARSLELVKKASDAGVPILCGSDTPNPFVVPGASLHEEIAELAKALGPAKALECATLANARALGRDDLGRIAEGARADLVLLSSDPRADAAAVQSIDAVIVRGHVHDRKALDARLASLEAKAKAADALPAAGFDAIAGTLSDRKPVTPEYRFAGKLGAFAPSFWVRMRSFEGPEEGQRMTFLRSSASLPVPLRASEDLLAAKDGRVLRYHMAVESLGARRETTVERREEGWRIQLFEKGEKKLEVTSPLGEEPSVQGELLLLQLASTLSLDVGSETTRKLRFIDLERMKVHDAVRWKIRRAKNPVTDANDARSRGDYFVASSEEAGKIRLWVAAGEPLGMALESPYGEFRIERVEGDY